MAPVTQAAGGRWSPRLNLFVNSNGGADAP
jgi:hypothetical protein